MSLDTRVVAEILTEVVVRLTDLQTSIDEVDQRTEAIAKALGVPPDPADCPPPSGDPRHHGQEPDVRPGDSLGFPPWVNGEEE